MKITIAPTKPQDGESPDCAFCTISIEHPSDDLDASDALDLARQALIAWGYAEKSINELIGGR